MKTGKHLYGSMTQHGMGVAQQECRLHAQHTLGPTSEGMCAMSLSSWAPKRLLGRKNCRSATIWDMFTSMYTKKKHFLCSDSLCVHFFFWGLQCRWESLAPVCPSCSSASPVACGSKTMENCNFLILPHRVPTETSSFDFWMSLMLPYLQSCFQVKMNELSVRNQENEFYTDIKSLKE